MNVVEIIAKLRDEATKGLEVLGTSLRKVADVGLEPIAKISPTAANALGGLLDKAGPTGLALGAIGGAAIGAVAGVVALGVHVSEVGDQLRETSQRTGVSVEAIQAIGQAMEKAGGSAADFSGVFKFMQRNLDDAADGSSKAAGAFRKLGLDVNELLKLDPEEQFAAIAKGIAGISDPTQKAAVAMDLFGRQGAQLIPLLNDVSEQGLQGVIDKAKELGGVISTQTAAQADQFQDTLKDLGKAGAALGIELGSAVLPLLVQIAEVLLTAAKAVNDFVRETGILTVIVKALEVALFPVVEGFKSLVAVAIAGKKALQGDFGGAIDVLAARMDEFGKDVNATFFGMTEAPKKVADATKVASESVRELSADQKKLLNEIAQAADQAAQVEVQARLAATKQEMAAVEAASTFAIGQATRERDEKLKALKDSNIGAAEASKAREDIERTFASKVIQIETDTAEKRKAILKGLTDSALQIFKDLGQAFEDTVKRLTLAQAIADTTAKIDTLRESFKAGVITQNEFLDGTRALQDNLMKLGATSQQVNLTITEATKETTRAITDNRNSVVEINGVWQQAGDSAKSYSAAASGVVSSGAAVTASVSGTAQAVDNLETQYKEAANAAEHLEDVQTGHSLDSSNRDIADSMHDARGAVEEATKALAFGAEATLTMTALQQQASQATDQAAASTTAATVATKEQAKEVDHLTGSVSLLDLLMGRHLGTQAQAAQSINMIINAMREQNREQKILHDFLAQALADDKAMGFSMDSQTDRIKENVKALESQAKALEAQIRYAKAFGLAVGALEDQLASLQKRIEQETATAELAIATNAKLRTFGSSSSSGTPGTQGSFQMGTDYVPATGRYWLHQGEQVVRAGLTGNLTVNVTIQGRATKEDGQSIARQVVGAIQNLQRRRAVNRF